MFSNLLKYLYSNIENLESLWCRLCLHWRHRPCQQWRQSWHHGHSPCSVNVHGLTRGPCQEHCNLVCVVFPRVLTCLHDTAGFPLHLWRWWKCWPFPCVRRTGGGWRPGRFHQWRWWSQPAPKPARERMMTSWHGNDSLTGLCEGFIWHNILLLSQWLNIKLPF